MNIQYLDPSLCLSMKEHNRLDPGIRIKITFHLELELSPASILDPPSPVSLKIPTLLPGCAFIRITVGPASAHKSGDLVQLKRKTQEFFQNLRIPTPPKDLFGGMDEIGQPVHNEDLIMDTAERIKDFDPPFPGKAENKREAGTCRLLSG